MSAEVCRRDRFAGGELMEIIGPCIEGGGGGGAGVRAEDGEYAPAPIEP